MFASHRITKFAGTALVAGALGLPPSPPPAPQALSARRMTRS